MSQHKPEWVSACLDGELHGFARWRFERHLRQCVICQADYRQLQKVRRLLAAHPPQARLDGSPEFFWAQVKRQIQARDAATATVPPAPVLGLVNWWRDHLTQLAAAAAALMILVTAIGLYRLGRDKPTELVQQPTSSPVVVQAATRIPDTAATTIAGQDEDVTVIWVSGLPWTESMTELQTYFAELDT